MKTKKFYKTMKLENLELNKIYNFQDTVILCSSHLQVHSVFVFIGTKINVVLPCQQMLNMSEYLKRR